MLGHKWFAWRPVIVPGTGGLWKRLKWLTFVNRYGVINWHGRHLRWEYI